MNKMVEQPTGRDKDSDVLPYWGVITMNGGCFGFRSRKLHQFHLHLLHSVVGGKSKNGVRTCFAPWDLGTRPSVGACLTSMIIRSPLSKLELLAKLFRVPPNSLFCFWNRQAIPELILIKKAPMEAALPIIEGNYVRYRLV